MKTNRYFLVTITLASPAYGTNREEEARYYATDSAEAVSMARREMRNAGHTRHDGKVSYRAKVDPNQQPEQSQFPD